MGGYIVAVVTIAFTLAMLIFPPGGMIASEITKGFLPCRKGLQIWVMMVAEFLTGGSMGCLQGAWFKESSRH